MGPAHRAITMEISTTIIELMTGHADRHGTRFGVVLESLRWWISDGFVPALGTQRVGRIWKTEPVTRRTGEIVLPVQLINKYNQGTVHPKAAEILFYTVGLFYSDGLR